MRITVRSIAFATLLISAPHVFAQRPYLTADGGAVFQQDSVLRQTSIPNFKATYNTGYRFDLNAGINFNDFFDAQIGAGYMWNSFDNVGGHPLSQNDQSVDFYSFPLLGELIFKIPTHCALEPYVGVGGGGVVSVYDFHDVNVRYEPTDVEPAAQGEVGLKYRLCRHASLGVSYKFLATMNERYSINSPEFSEKIKVDNIFVHGVFLNFTLIF